MLTKVIKRDGRVVDFDQERIINAIFKAAKAVGGEDRRQACELSNQVVSILTEKFAGRMPTVEDIQDVVEKVLIENGHAKTAKAYIVYRRQQEEKRDFRDLLVNAERMIDEYVDDTNWKVKE
ncbi:MAG: ATP cone domain-containing protein, partial [Limnochordia bacterium]|nr:ATP cone domain-containing protein [Limnochordia bacterium]